MDRNGPEGVLRRALEVLSAGPAGILTDLDGTLAAIIPDPDAVRAAPGVPAALSALAGRLAVVGVVTGRAAGDVRRILGPSAERLLVIGNHGLEWIEPGAAGATPTPELEAAAAAVRSALGALDALADRGIRVEDKGLSATVHYRSAADPASARARIAAALRPALGERLEMRHGRMSVELRPVGVGDKGTAVASVVERYGLRGLLVAGDDVTDLDMFRTARRLRSAGDLRALVVGVGGGAEVPPEVVAAADVVLDGPEAVSALFAALAERL